MSRSINLKRNSPDDDDQLTSKKQKCLNSNVEDYLPDPVQINDILSKNTNTNYEQYLIIHQLDILSCLQPRDWAAMTRVSLRWRNYCQDSCLWKSFNPPKLNRGKMKEINSRWRTYYRYALSKKKPCHFGVDYPPHLGIELLQDYQLVMINHIETWYINDNPHQTHRLSMCLNITSANISSCEEKIFLTQVLPNLPKNTKITLHMHKNVCLTSILFNHSLSLSSCIRGIRFDGSIWSFSTGVHVNNHIRAIACEQSALVGKFPLLEYLCVKGLICGSISISCRDQLKQYTSSIKTLILHNAGDFKRLEPEIFRKVERLRVYNVKDLVLFESWLSRMYIEGFLPNLNTIEVYIYIISCCEKSLCICDIVM